jgi:CheY-like chemotaxis protein
MVVRVWDVLVMTPVRSFGELLQQALQETDLYRVTLVHDEQGLLSALRDQEFPVLVLDLDLEPDTAALLDTVDGANPHAGLIVLRNQAGDSSDLPTGSRVTRLLSDRFYLPDLLDALQAVTKKLDAGLFPIPLPRLDQGSMADGTLSSLPIWMESPDQIAQRLSRISFNDPVQAAIILSDGQLWAFAGQLPRTAGDELAQILHFLWTPHPSSDLARFIHLDSTGEEYLLYATGLGGEAVLGLTLADETPFSTTRIQTREVVNRLAAWQEDTQETSP